METENKPAPTPEERRASRAILILYIVMGVFIVLPFLVYFLFVR